MRYTPLPQSLSSALPQTIRPRRAIVQAISHRDLWWTKWRREQVSQEYFCFPYPGMVQ